ncbi:stress response protein, TerZ- and CABP1 [Actinomadura verrucosospora]|uniref:Stress response protein, TerZ-and CABP1 n=1 Tax=Actinomadura verrucosospora TaxID=46165 RepID=A0A7D3W690_ACTVE|nr:TerD family protein [Actinomadura verrucosospora]QKG27151.1 stress response protein, TerZ- and CABP1 [Actinomadura verrucosospora]
MQQMSKGANVDLSSLTASTGPLTVALSWIDPSGEGEADVSVLLAGSNGKVGGDADFVFYNQPTTADESVRLLGKSPTATGSEDRILVDLGTLRPDVQRVVIAASRYAGATFGALDELCLTISDSTGVELLAFPIKDADSETAFIFGELYRRDDGWKFRAVGQGYASGLAGLAADFGISVDDSEEQQPEPAPAHPADAPTVDEPGAITDHATAKASSTESKRPQRVRTAKKKVTAPKAAKASLAEHPSWQHARLFSVTGLRNDQEREARATATLLAVMAQVPEFGRRLTARFNAPAGTIQTFAEASFKHGDGKVRPDGVLRVARAGRIWTALIETKTGGNPLKADQVEAYLQVAARHGYETVITLSNDLALTNEHPLQVDKRLLRKVALRHLSWAEVAHEADMLCHHDGVANPVHAWLLSELLHYLRQDNAGCQGFRDMGAAWVPVRNAVTAGTLRLGDRRAMHVAESWEKLLRQLCLRLSGQTGLTIAPVLRKRRDGDASVRRLQTVTSLVETGRMSAEIRIPNAGGPILLEADLRTGQIETTVEIPAAARARSLTRVQWLLRQLGQAPPELRIEALTAGHSTGPCDLLKNLIAEPGLLVPDDAEQITSFRLTLSSSMGTKRGTEETGFVRSIDLAMDRFYREILLVLKPDTTQ